MRALFGFILIVAILGTAYYGYVSVIKQGFNSKSTIQRIDDTDARQTQAQKTTDIQDRQDDLRRQREDQMRAAQSQQDRMRQQQQQMRDMQRR